MLADVRDTKQSVDAILDLVRGSTEAIEESRCLPDAVVQALRAAGVNRLLIPEALGGMQASVLDVMDVIERLAAADGSTGWCAAIGAGSNLFAGYLPEAGAAEVFADPDQGNATMFAPVGRVEEIDGQRLLSGRWPFTSNCLHSAWVGLGALVDDSGPDAVPRVTFVPMEALTIEDTWDVIGLRGTGSHHVQAQAVVVSPARTCAWGDRPWAEGTLWRLPIYAALLPTLVAVPLGIARGALDEIARQAVQGRTARRGQLTDDPMAMADFAVADNRLRGARAELRDALEEAHELAERGEPVGRQLQARIMLGAIEACDVSVEVTSTCHRLGGGAATYRGSALLRALCDVQAARQHLLFSHHHRAAFGRILAGVDGTYPPFIL